MYKTLLLSLSLITLSACTQDSDNDTFICDNQLEAKLSSESEEAANLTYNEQDYALVRQRSASGVKYSNDDVLFWSKGSEAMLIIDGNKYHCQLQ